MSEQNQPSGTADERSDTDLPPVDERTSRSRMAREAKIGLGVILVLLVVLVAVIYDRMTGVDENLVASAEAGSSEAEDEGTPAREQPDSASSPAAWSQPTVMEAKAGSGDALQASQSSDLDSWGFAAEDSQATHNSADTTAPSPPPSFMPRLAAPTPADRDSGRATMQMAGRTTWNWQSGQPAGTLPSVGHRDAPPRHREDMEMPSRMAGQADDRQPYDRFQGPSTPAVADHAEVGAPDTAGSLGSRLPATELNPVSQPSLQQTTNLYPSSIQQQDTLPGRTDTAETATSTGTTRPLPYSDRSGNLYQLSESVEQQAGPAETPTYRASPHSSYRASGELSAPTLQVGQAAGTSGQSDLGQVRPSDRASTFSEPGSDGTYLVQPNDNYWAISEKLYGTGAYFRALAEHNRANVPDENRLQVGEQILAPDATELEKAYPGLCPKLAHRRAAQRRASLGSVQSASGTGRVYVVQEGDNLFDIARYELGKPTRWTEIVNLNQELLGSDLDQLNYLTPGMRLILPEPAQQLPAAVARQRESLYER